jgi:1-deoxy-D-xylulose-5-phosphate reductoisomerase
MKRILNASKEIALDAFIDEKVGFLQMADIVENTMDHMSAHSTKEITIGTIYDADVTAREHASQFINHLA